MIFKRVAGLCFYAKSLMDSFRRALQTYGNIFLKFRNQYELITIL